MAMQLVSETASDGIPGPGAPTLYPTLDGVDLSNIEQFTRGQPYGDFARLRAQAPVMWHPCLLYTSPSPRD